jgi:endonuclease/exonuclease/phosphatase family metal-dependent hydrolase
MLRLMTHNVWECDDNTTSWKDAGNDCSAQARVKGIMRVYDETSPDVIGFQEMTTLMADLIKEEFISRNQNYALIWGRFTPIMYNVDKFELIDTEFYTFDEHIDGYEGIFNNDQRKSWCIVVLREKQTGKVFAFANTHLWWKSSPSNDEQLKLFNFQRFSDEARQVQLMQVAGRLNYYIKKYDCPAFLVGDLNSWYTSKAIVSLLADDYKHARYLAVDFADASMGYHYCYPDRFETKYNDGPFEKALDYIFAKNIKDGAIKVFKRYSPDYYFPISDHSPAFVDVEL